MTERPNDGVHQNRPDTSGAGQDTSYLPTTSAPNPWVAPAGPTASLPPAVQPAAVQPVQPAAAQPTPARPAPAATAAYPSAAWSAHTQPAAPYAAYPGLPNSSTPPAHPAAARQASGHGAPPVYPPNGATADGGSFQAPRHTEPRRPRTWLAVTAAAVLAAGLATGGTALVMDNHNGAASASSSSLGNQGQTTNTSQVVTGAPNWEEVAKNVRPAVVAIAVKMANGEAEGSGVVLDSAGHILTNNHVVAGGTALAVTLSDGRIFDATVVGTDPTTDLAVIKLTDPPSGLTAASLGSSAGLQVGAPVAAVGNPLGLSSTVTTGIVSALDRPVTASDGQGSQPTVTNAIQIDAAVNPGNSGGPLFDSGGKVVGITSSIATMSQGSGSIGLGFAIPIDLAKSVAEQLIQNGVAQHAFLGVSLQDGQASADGTTRTGAQVQQVTQGSPAAQAGIQVGDVITGIGDHAVGGADALTGWVRTYASGEKVAVTLVRDGKEVTADVTLATRPETN